MARIVVGGQSARALVSGSACRLAQDEETDCLSARPNVEHLRLSGGCPYAGHAHILPGRSSAAGLSVPH